MYALAQGLTWPIRELAGSGPGRTRAGIVTAMSSMTEATPSRADPGTTKANCSAELDSECVGSHYVMQWVHERRAQITGDLSVIAHSR